MTRRPSAVVFLGLALGLLAASGCLSTGEPGDGSRVGNQSGWQDGALRDIQVIAEGRRIAQGKCAQCHSIDDASVSRDPMAPPFRDFAVLNHPEWIAYRLMDGLRLGHDSMPLFDLDVGSTDALMAYISSLSD